MEGTTRLASKVGTGSVRLCGHIERLNEAKESGVHLHISTD